MKAKFLTMISALAFLLAANHGFASPEYVDLIPNGSVNSCLTCHVNADPDAAGTTRNSFGLAWRNNTPARTYNALLASKDSDGDTFTNGQELGDPAGTWVVGNPNPPGPVFLPGNAASHPTASTPPAITSAPPPATGTVGTSYNFTVTATGTAPITFTASGLPGGLGISGAGAISGTPTTAGTFNGTITAANSTLPDATQAFTIVISEAPVAPTITSAPPPATGTVGTSYNFTVTATGTTPITFTASGLPGGLGISGAGAISGTPTTAGTFNGTITAANSTLPDATQAFTIVISEAPVAPTITSPPPTATGTVGTSYNFTVTATGTAPITFTASGLPGGLGISSAGAISGTPTTAGTFNGTITAANGTLPDATQAFTILISAAPVAPTITSAPLPATGTVDTSYDFAVTATGTAPITFTASGLPAGLGISSAGAISGTPTTAGTFNGTITAANGTLPDATQAFTILISAVPVAPTITSAPLPATGTVDTSYDFTVTATGTAPITFTASGLPAGLGISSAGAISGTPTTAGTFNGTITAANGTLPDATQAFTIVISKATPTVTTWPTASAIAYGQTLASSTLSGGLSSVPGTFVFTTPGTAPAVGTASHEVTFTPTVTANYNTVSGYASVTVNAVGNAPVAVNDTLGTVKNEAVSLPAADLAANDTDADGDPLTVTAVSTPSTAGGTVALTAGTVTYTPPTDATGADSFTYTISDGHGNTAIGTVNVTITSSTEISPNLVYGPVVDGGNFVVRFAGIPGRTYTIEHTDNLTKPITWQKAVNLTAPTDAGSWGQGVFQFSEPIGAPMRYYRIVYPAY